MSTHQCQLDNANAAAAFVASLNAISYFNYEKILDAKNNNNSQISNYQAIRNMNSSSNDTNPFLFPVSQTAAIALAAAASPFHQQFQQHLTQQFQNHITQLRQDVASTSTSATSNKHINARTLSSKHQLPEIKVMDENDLPKDDSKCHACGDKSTGSHFGGISCESCKAFFRRSVQRNRWEEYKCSYNCECKMNTNTRKICQYCRYKMCLSIGMRPKWVLSDDERQQKYGSRRKKNKLAAAAAAAAAVAEAEAKEKDEDEDETTESLDAKFYKFGVEAINEQNKSLKSYDEVLINKLTYAFYYSRQSHDLDLNSIELKMQHLLHLNSNSNDRKDELSKLSKLILANFMVQPVKRVITFAKLLPDFRNLVIEDQMALLRGSTMEIFICSSQNLFDKTTNSFNNLISRERELSTNDSTNGSNSIKLDILRFIWSDDVLERTLSYLKSMNDLNIDETTLILYLPLILFSPDRRELINREHVMQIQNKFSILLYKYLLFKYNRQIDVVDKLFTKLLLKMMDLRDLHELHSSILLDVADSSELELYSHAIIRNNKDENDKLPHRGIKRAKLIKREFDSDSDSPMNNSSASPNTTFSS